DRGWAELSFGIGQFSQGALATVRDVASTTATIPSGGPALTRSTAILLAVGLVAAAGLGLFRRGR
ncbi:MAG: hypothetical protein R3344_11875, partial [Acidobacteriota bacterium]|nr:hypothetical protein [Acidobacteriota bacterium]